MPPLVTDGLVAHYDADAITGLSDTDPVSQWDDLSGSALHAVSTGTARPLYRTGVLNGLPVVDFDGVNDILTAPAFATPLAQPNTVFFVGKTDDITGASGSQMFVASADSARRQNFFITGAPLWAMLAGSTDTSTYPVDDDPHYFTAVFDGASSLARIGTQTLIGIDNPGTEAFGRIRLGAQHTPNGFLNGYLAEVLVYNRRLSAAELNEVGNYLQDKWFPARTTTGPIYARYEMLGDLDLVSGVDTTVDVWDVRESSGTLPVTDNGDGTFTVTQAGTYRIVGGGDFRASSQGLFTRRVTVEVNGVPVVGRSSAGNSHDSFSTSDSGPIALAVNDVVRMRAYQDSGLTEPLQASGHTVFLTIQQLDTNYKRYGLTANQSITQNTATLVDFDVEDETGGTTDLTLNADGSVTVNEAGVYRMRASSDWAVPANQNGRRYLEIVVNQGSDVVRSAHDIGRDAEDAYCVADTGPMLLGVGDVVKVNVYQNCDATLALEDTRATWLTVEKLPADTAFKRWEQAIDQGVAASLEKIVWDSTPTESSGTLPATMTNSQIAFTQDGVFEVIVSCQWASDDLGGGTGVNVTESGWEGADQQGRFSVAATRAGNTAGPQRGVAATAPWIRKTTDPTIEGVARNNSGASRNLLANDRTFLTVLQVEDFAASGGVTVQASPATLTLTAQTTSPTPAALAVQAGPAGLNLVASQVTPTPGPLAVSASPAGVSLEAQAVNPVIVGGPVSVTLVPASISLSASVVGVGSGQVFRVEQAASVSALVEGA